MAATLTTQTLQDGERNAIIKGHIVGDGLGELTDGLLVDVSGLSGAPTTVKVRSIKANTVGMSLILEWDATTDVPITVIPANETVDQDYSKEAGLQNNAGAGVTGDIVVTTVGEAAGNDATIIIHVQKS